VTERYLTLKELAELWNVEEKVIYGLRYREGGPPADRIGRELRFKPSECERWLADRAEASRGGQ
jgi:predicted DNA-binding transcriptional regulator AlpA